MGYRLALAVEIQCRASPNAFRILNRMAWWAMDRDTKNRPARIYFGGWEHLALIWPDKSPAAAEQTIARAIRELSRSGYIKTLGKPAIGANQRYELLVDLVDKQSTPGG